MQHACVMWSGTPGHRILPKQYVLLAHACTHGPGCRPAQTLQDRAKQLEASTSTSAAAMDAAMADLRIQLEAERAEARRAKMEASSTAKQYEALVARLRREADASEWGSRRACGGQQCRQRRAAVADGSGCSRKTCCKASSCVAVVQHDSLCLLSSCVSRQVPRRSAACEACSRVLLAPPTRETSQVLLPGRGRRTSTKS